MRRTTRTAIFALAAAAVVALTAATYAFGREPGRQAHFAGGSPSSGPSASTAPDRPGQPSATGEDGGPGPSGSASPSTAPAKKTGCPVGPHQRAVEQHLAKLGGFGAVTVDGQQSPRDCAAIKKFQRRYAISPATGRAGPQTDAAARRLAETRLDACDAGGGLTVCLDLTHQTMWVVRGGKVVLGPTLVRTGRAGLTTPSGHYTITEKKRRPMSSYYKVPLPYWQRFTGDIGFHETPSYLHEGPGSHGCVNLLSSDAVALWQLTSVGTSVHSFGRKPGT
ncbi:MAG: L,D-transpeptidase family protein [Micromonosporaceae bacterium]